MIQLARVLALLSLLAVPPPRGARPNIVLIVSDAQVSADLGCIAPLPVKPPSEHEYIAFLL